VTWTRYFWRVWGDFGINTKQVALTLVFLPHQAWLMGDAIARVAYRKLISGERLLEWAPSDQTENGRKPMISIIIVRIETESGGGKSRCSQLLCRWGSTYSGRCH
jgi:hypothetical protein